MNSVHKPSSRTMFKKFDSGKYRVKTDQKWAECTAPSQPARPATPCRAPRASHVCRAPARSAPARPPAHPARPAARPAAQSTVTIQFFFFYCDIVWPPTACCNTIHCIATQLSSSPSSLLQYNPVFISAIQTTVLQHKTHILAF